jgi:hypothetical protein
MVASGERVTARAAPASLSAPGPAWLAASPNAPTAFSLMSSPHFSRKSSAFSSRGGGTRTHTVRILSPKTCVLACPSVSGNWPYLCGFRRLSCCRCSVRLCPSPVAVRSRVLEAFLLLPCGVSSYGHL